MTEHVKDALITMLGMAAGGAAFVGIIGGAIYFFFRGPFEAVITRWLKLLLALFVLGFATCCAFIALSISFGLAAALGHSPFYPLAGGFAAGLVVVLAFIIRENRRRT